jgi:hypothetical protein
MVLRKPTALMVIESSVQADVKSQAWKFFADVGTMAVTGFEIVFHVFRLGTAMSSRQRLAIVATEFLLLAIVRDYGPLARSSDAVQTVHEAAVLHRIFSNWKLRHDRVQSLHVTIDCRRSSRGTSQRTGRRPGALAPVFEQSGVQLWIQGDDRIYLASTPVFEVPQAKLMDIRRVVSRDVSVGQMSLFLATDWTDPETGTPRPRAFAPLALVSRSARGRPRLLGAVVLPLLLTFRPQHPELSWLRDECRLVDEDAIIDNGHFLRFQRFVEDLRRDETCWVSPARDDVVVHWRHATKEVVTEGSIKYKKDTTSGWMPWEWIEYRGETVSEYRVTSYEVNPKIDPAIFSQEIPAATTVILVEPDGLRRPISHKDYRRLMGLSNPPTKEAPGVKP